MLFTGVLKSVIGLGEIVATDQDGNQRIVNKAISDYAIGVVLFESYKYTSIEKYKENREVALRKLHYSAKCGLPQAQYYLGNLYLSDSIINNKTKGIKWLKKAAFQRDPEAMQALNDLHIEYSMISIEEDTPQSVTLLYCLIPLHLMFAFLGHVRVTKSELMTPKRKKYHFKSTWLIPVIGAFQAIRSSKKMIIPLNPKDADWIQQALNWLFHELKINPNDIQMYYAKNESISIKYDGSEQSAIDTVQFISSQMGLDYKLIDLQFFDQTNVLLDQTIFTNNYDGDSNSTGLYFGKNLFGKYEIGLEKSQLKRPHNMISTLAHELSHVLLLGEIKLEQNDEYLTDLTPLLFGFGVFSANSAFEFTQASEGWGYRRQGYLSQQMWGFALAYLSTLRNSEDNNWVDHLNESVKEDYNRSVIYLNEKSR